MVNHERQQHSGSLSPERPILTKQVIFVEPGTNLPVYAYHIKAKEPGNFIGVVGGMHGDEWTGAYVAKCVIDLAMNGIDRGEVFVIPVANPGGLIHKQRGLVYVRNGYNTDLNREITLGNGQTPAARHGNAIALPLIEHYQDHHYGLVRQGSANQDDFTGIVVDVHTEDIVTDPRNILPYVRIDRTADARLLQFLIATAQRLNRAGILVRMEYPKDYFDKEGLDRSLSTVLVANQVPAITGEAGPYRYVDLHHAGVFLAGFKILFDHFHMSKSSHPNNTNGKLSDSANSQGDQSMLNGESQIPPELADGLVAGGGEVYPPGRIEFYIRPGQTVLKGQPVGLLTSQRGEKFVLPAPTSGQVISLGEPRFPNKYWTLYLAGVPVDDLGLIEIFSATD